MKATPYMKTSLDELQTLEDRFNAQNLPGYGLRTAQVNDIFVHLGVTPRAAVTLAVNAASKNCP